MMVPILLFLVAIWATPAAVLAALFFLPCGSPAFDRGERLLALLVVVFWPVAIVGGIILDTAADRRCGR